MYIPYEPLNTEPLTLFEYAVRKVQSLGMMNDSNIHQAWATKIFGYEKNAKFRGELMSVIKREYGAYFDKDSFPEYKFLKDKIKANFPYLFGVEEDKDLFTIMLKALDAECNEQRSPKNRKSYRIASCDVISSTDSQYIYKANLVIEDGEDPHFSEGISFNVRTDDNYFQCEVVEYDYVNATLFFSSSRRIFLNFNSRVLTDATMNTVALIKVLQDISETHIDETLPIHKFLNGTTRNISKISHSQYPSYLDSLLCNDQSQFRAFNAALSNDITFIWGPPGTGKSYTLAVIIMALYYMSGERTAVCCLSNVAVDQLVEKVVEIIEVNEPKMVRGKFYRAGRTQDEKLIATDFLFPDDDMSKNLRLMIKLLNSKIDKFKKHGEQFSDEAIKIKAKLKDSRALLKEHTDYLINKVKVVFSTIANFVINPRLKDGDFDNLIVDEASMLAEPQLIALARRVHKRIILVGDFQQLSPITVAGLPILRDNVFKLCGIDINHTDHPALHQLLSQRRSNPKLVDVINHSFYADRLNAVKNKNHPIVARAPYSGSVVGAMDITNGAVRFTKGGTRQNKANAEAVMRLLDLYSKEKEETFSIGVITPYTGQVALLKALFIEKEYNLDFQNRVRIGTVHTFQGSESDVIIFDMVDCSKFEKGKKTYFGKIYAGEQGEELPNVAISRAKNKLIVICDLNYLRDCPGGIISNKSISIFQYFLKASREIL